MDSSERTQATVHHYWLTALVISAGLAVSWLVADKAISDYQKRAIDQHQQQHNLLHTRLQGRINSLLESIGWVVISARDSPTMMRHSIAAFTNSYPSIMSAGLVRHSAASDELLWEYSSVLHRQSNRLPLLLEEARALSGLMENPPASAAVIVTPRISLSMENQLQQATGLLRQAGDNLWLVLLVDPTALLKSLVGAPDTTLDAIRIHDLDQHSKTPLYETGTIEETGYLQQRSELSVGNRSWLLATYARPGELAPGAWHSWQSVWLTGLTITGLFALVCYLLGRRTSRLQSGNRECLQKLKEQRQQLGNLRVEKNIIRQALEECEQRTRDLVELSPDITAELDESGRIGFISGQVADQLGQAPADLDGQPLSNLLAERHRQVLTTALEAARQEHTIQTTDIRLLNREGDEVNARVRILSLRNAVYGCTGYRLGIRIG